MHAFSREEADKLGAVHMEDKFPLSVMAFVAVTKHGATPVLFVPKGKTVTAEYYTRTILPYCKRHGNEMFGSRRWVSIDKCTVIYVPSNIDNNTLKNNIGVSARRSASSYF